MYGVSECKQNRSTKLALSLRASSELRISNFPYSKKTCFSRPVQTVKSEASVGFVRPAEAGDQIFFCKIWKSRRKNKQGQQIENPSSPSWHTAVSPGDLVRFRTWFSKFSNLLIGIRQNLFGQASVAGRYSGSS